MRVSRGDGGNEKGRRGCEGEETVQNQALSLGASMSGNRQTAGKDCNSHPPSPSLAPQGLHPPLAPPACLQLTPRVPLRGKRGLGCPWSPICGASQLDSNELPEPERQEAGGWGWGPGFLPKIGRLRAGAKMPGSPTLDASLGEDAGSQFRAGEEASRELSSVLGGLRPAWVQGGPSQP